MLLIRRWPVLRNASFVKVETLDRVDRMFPWRLGNDCFGVGISGRPSRLDSSAAEVDVLHMILIGDARGEQMDHMHLSDASIGRHLFDGRIVTLAVRQSV
jgi:hypothetical protein